MSAGLICSFFLNAQMHLKWICACRRESCISRNAWVYEKTATHINWLHCLGIPEMPDFLSSIAFNTYAGFPRYPRGVTFLINLKPEYQNSAIELKMVFFPRYSRFFRLRIARTAITKTANSNDRLCYSWPFRILPSTRYSQFNLPSKSVLSKNFAKQTVRFGYVIFDSFPTSMAVLIWAWKIWMKVKWLLLKTLCTVSSFQVRHQFFCTYVSLHL